MNAGLDDLCDKIVRLIQEEEAWRQQFNSDTPQRERRAAIVKDALQPLYAELDRLTAFQNDVSAELAAEGAGTLEHLIACAMLGKHCSVIGNTRYAQLRAAEEELALWKPMTPEEAEAAMDAAEAVPMSEEEINRIVEWATDPARRPTNCEWAQMAVRIKRLEAALERLTRQATMTDDYRDAADGTLHSAVRQALKALGKESVADV